MCVTVLEYMVRCSATVPGRLYEYLIYGMCVTVLEYMVRRSATVPGRLYEYLTWNVCHCTGIHGTL